MITLDKMYHKNYFFAGQNRLAKCYVHVMFAMMSIFNQLTMNHNYSKNGNILLQKYVDSYNSLR